MISGNAKKGFLAAHWDWLAAAAGVVALGAAAYFMLSDMAESPDAAAARVTSELESARPTKTGVKPIEMVAYDLALKNLHTPNKVAVPELAGGCFLAPECRFFCQQGVAGEPPSCGLPIAEGLKKCPFCGAQQPEEQKKTIDSDGDGMPDEWEVAHGLDPKNPNDANDDADGDGFTNGEEYASETNPTDAASHPAYWDSLRVVAPLKQTLLPFYLERVSETPNGIRFNFKDPNKKSAYGSLGLVYNPLKGEDIGDTGFMVKDFEKKTERVKIKGSNVEKVVDRSVAVVVRKRDGKLVRLPVEKTFVPIDIQAHLVYERGGVKDFDVVKDDIIDLNNEKFKILDISEKGGKIEVIVQSCLSGQTKTL